MIHALNEYGAVDAVQIHKPDEILDHDPDIPAAGLPFRRCG